MTRAVGVLGLVLVLAGAGPRTKHVPSRSADPAVVEAERLWTAAEAERDRAAAPAAWQRAAEAFGVVVDSTTATTAERTEAAYAAVLAWKNSLSVSVTVREAPRDEDAAAKPTELEPREAAMVHAIDAYLGFGPPADEVASLQFVRANVLRRHHRLDEANAIYTELLANHRDHEVAEYAANLLLDGYNLQQKYDELVALAEALRADKPFLADKPDLARVVDVIHVTSLRRHAEALERDARAKGDDALYEQCGRAYRAIAVDAAAARVEGADEALYNAMVCFQDARSADAAVAAAEALIGGFPRSELSMRALARVAMIESGRARYAAALDALEAYVVRARAKDVLAAASDGVYYALALGDPARAARIIDRAKLAPAVAMQAGVVVVEAMLRAGERKAATQRARGLAKTVASLRDDDPRQAVSLGHALAGAACPVEPVDELCPRVRDKALVTAARAAFARAERSGAVATDPAAADLAARLAIDLDLEPVLASKHPAARAVAAVVDGYQALIDPDIAAEVRVVAHARLGQLARHLGTADDAAKELRACVAEARREAVGGEWLAGCERGLADLGQPDADLLAELLVPAPSTIPMSTEGP